MSTALALRSYMLARLEDGGALSAVGLDLSMRPNLSYEQYEAIGVLLGRATSALRFAVGDWLLFGEEVFGERAAQASELLGMSPEGRMELARVARQVPRSMRRARLSWTHHRAVASRRLDLRQRRVLLDRAEHEGLTANELSVAAQALCDGASLPGKDRNGTCEELLDQVAASLREQLVACGYPDDLVLSIEVAVPPGITVAVRTGP